MEQTKAAGSGSRSHSPSPESSAKSGHRAVSIKPVESIPLQTELTHSPPCGIPEADVSAISSESSLSEDTCNKLQTDIVAQCQEMFKVTIDEVPEALKMLSDEHRAMKSVLLPDRSSDDETLSNTLKREDIKSFQAVVDIGFAITDCKKKIKDFNETLRQQSEAYMQSLDSLQKRYQNLTEGQSSSSLKPDELISETYKILQSLKENFSNIQTIQGALKEKYEQMSPNEGRRRYLESKHLAIRTLSEKLSKYASTSTQKRPADTSAPEEQEPAKKAKRDDTESSS